MAPPTERRREWRRWIVLNATVFVSAACIMTVEILSTRLTARHLGSSLYTWTSAIGVVLAGISVGNYVGGRLADRFEPRRTLSLLFVASSLACASIPMVNGWMGGWSVLVGQSWPLRVFIHFALTFLFPATLLGTMSPVVAKMALDLGQGPGRTVGTIYAWGSIGSIVGTFAAGFFLVAWMGTEIAILCIAGVLAVVGVLYGWRSLTPYAWTAAYGCAVTAALAPWSGGEAVAEALGLRDAMAEHALFLEDSQYQRVLVVPHGSDERALILDKLVHSVVDLSDPRNLGYGYEAIYAEVMRRCVADGEPLSALFIGGGGYVLPRYVEVAYPGSRLEVAEIDPVVTRAAFEVLGVPSATSIASYEMDGRNRVADLIEGVRSGEQPPAFDFVFGDAFNDYSVPFHLTTLEFDRQLHELLAEDGVYMLNLVDSLELGRFLGSVVRTCREVFPHVQVFAGGSNPRVRSTFVVVASRGPLDLHTIPDEVRARHGVACSLLGADELAGLNEGALVLTDDHAPVENLLAEVVRRYPVARPASAPASGAERHVALGMLLYSRGDATAAVEHLEEALRLAPDYAGLQHDLAVACDRSGRDLAERGELDAATGAFERAVELQPEIATYRKNLGLALEQRGDHARAVEQYRACLSLEEQLPVMNSLALLLATSPDAGVRNGPEAVRWAEQLIEELGGDHAEVLGTLAAALAAAGRKEEAQETARRAIVLAEAQGAPELATRLREELESYMSP